MVVALKVNRSQGAVAVTVSAETGGTLLSRHLYGVTGPAEMVAQAGSEVRTKAVEVVLALDVSHSMKNPRARAARKNGYLWYAARRKAMLNTLDVGDGPVAMGVVPWERMVRLDATLRADWNTDGVVALPATRTYRAPWNDTASAANALTQDPAEHRLADLGGLPRHPLALDHRRRRAHRGCPAKCRPRAPRSPTGCTPPSTASPTSASRRRTPTTAGWAATRPPPPPPMITTCGADRAQDGCSSSFPSMVPLSTDATALGAAIDALTYSGIEGRRTYSAPGDCVGDAHARPRLAHALGGEIPTPSTPDDRAYLEVHKIIVLLTDGEDITEDTRTQEELVFGHTLASLQASACTAAKDAGAIVYVVGVIEDSKIDQTMRDQLIACSSAADATEADSYVFLGAITDTDIEDAFSAIATRLTSLRRTH